MHEPYPWREVAVEGPPDGEPVLVVTGKGRYAVLVWWEEAEADEVQWTEVHGAPWEGDEPVWWFPLPPCKPGVVWVPRG